MKRVVWVKPDYFVERPGNVLAAVAAAFLGALWFVFALLMLAWWSWQAAVVLTLGTLVLGVPAWVLADRWGVRKRWKVALVESAVEVPGGMALEVVDVKGNAHDVMTDPVNGHALATVLMRR
ncbi:hypothetical protein [Demequina flava]|uniref:hypothetical protein n=1 Tax=Demequina flava TaxID=1095025 RepID=UPI000784ADE6|nr:hypothetical protein [Demequina flava]